MESAQAAPSETPPGYLIAPAVLIFSIDLNKLILSYDMVEEFYQKRQEAADMNITVYLGANEGNDPSLKDAVTELGRWIAESGNNLVYGGSRPGLMGMLADAVLENGGTATGVQVDLFIHEECYHGLTKLYVTKTMAERKAKMEELGDVFIAFPGGAGTLDEITEIISMESLDQTTAPCILYNLHGYYDGLKAQLDRMIESGLCTKERLKRVYFVNTLEEIQKIIDG